MAHQRERRAPVAPDEHVAARPRRREPHPHRGAAGEIDPGGAARQKSIRKKIRHRACRRVLQDDFRVEIGRIPATFSRREPGMLQKVRIQF